MRKWCGVRIADFAEHFSQKSKLGKKQGKFGIATFTDATEKQMNIVLMAKDGRRATMDVRGKLVELLSEYFDIGDSYAYNLTRVKSAFAWGTMGLDDFEEFDEETVADIADHLIAHGVTVREWISVKDRLPQKQGFYRVYHKNSKAICDRFYYKDCPDLFVNVKDDPITHWKPMEQPPKGE